MLRCSEKAFAKCPGSYLCGTRGDATFTEGSECAAFNREVEDKPMSNADCIQTIQQLEKLLTRAAADGCPPDMDWDCAKSEYGWDACDACWERWLRQPAKEETT